MLKLRKPKLLGWKEKLLINMNHKKTKAELREIRRLKQRFAPKGGTLAGQVLRTKTSRLYLKRKKINPKS